MAAENEVDVESDDHSDTEDPKQHARLISAITRLDYKQRVKPPSRKEPSVQVSEFHLAKEKTSRRNNAVSVKELAGVLGKGTKPLAVISRKIQTAEKKAKTLPKPLERIHADKVKRSTGFEKAKEILTVWEPLVQSNRVADQLSFPLENNRIKVHETNIFTSAMEPKTDLEKEMHEVLKSSGYIQPQEEQVEDDFPLTLEEVLAHRREAARLKALVQRQQIKTWQQNRIKSKKFHRILRKERVRQQIKEFEGLKETNPEEALRRLDQLERTRVQERASLRHRNTGAWARSKAIRAKYDRESRQVLAQQLSISRELTQKLKPVDDSSDSDTDGGEDIPDLVPISDTPSENLNSDVNNFVNSYRKFWEESNKKIKASKKDDVNSEHHITQQEQDVDNMYAVQSVDSVTFSDSEPKKVTKKGRKLSISSLDSEAEKVKSKKKRKSAEAKCITGNWTVTEINNDRNIKNENSQGVTSKKKKKTSSMQELTSVQQLTPASKENKTSIKKSGKSTNKDVDIVDLFTEFENKQEKLITKSLNKLKEAALNVNDECSKKKKKKKKKSEVDGESVSKGKKQKKKKSSESNNDIVVSLRPTPEERRAISFPLNEGPEKVDQSLENNIIKLVNIVEGGNDPRGSEPKKQLGAKDNIDPTKFLSAKPLKSRSAEMVSSGLEDLDDMEEAEAAKNRVDIAEAFADDDVVDEFRQEKEDLENASKPKEVDLVLPGWGEWGGTGIDASRRKRKRFILKPTEEAPRIDRDKRNVIIYEGKDSGLVKHQVSDLPYPFSSVHDFEASIRAPIGNTWVPETAHRKLTASRVVTRQGQVIAPITEDAITTTEEFRKYRKESIKRKNKQK